MQSITNSFEIIIAEDGSTDGTDRIARELASKYQRVLHLHSDIRQGRGKALNRAFKASSGKILVYIDVDLATDMKHLSELISAIREGYDFATGSRMLLGSQVKRSFKRGFASYGFNFLTRLFLRSKIHDHQAGFKAFKREPLFNLLDEVSDEHWFWDTELLVRAQKKGYSVKEFPVKWEHGGTSKVDLINDIIGMGSQIFRLWWELSASKTLNKNRKIVGSSIIAVVILFLISTFIGPEDIIKAAYTASLPLIILSLGIYILSWPVRGIRYQQILKKLNYKENLNFLIGTIFLSQTANVILPARIGDITRAYLLNKKDIPLTSGFSSLAVERVFDVLAISIIGTIAMLIAIREYHIDGNIKYIVLVSVILIITVFLLIFIAAKNRGKYIKKIINVISKGEYTENVIKVITKFITEIRFVSTSPKHFSIILSSSLLIWTIDILTCYVILMAFSQYPAIAIVFLAVAIGNLAKIFPITPGAIGTYEMALTTVFSLGGISPNISFAVAIIDHIVKNSITLIFGGLYLSHFNLRWRDLKYTKVASSE